MPNIAAFTPTFRRDLACFGELHKSVLRFTPEEVVHHIVVPREDVALFSRWKSSRLVIHTTNEVLPPSFLSVSPLSKALYSVSGLHDIKALKALGRGELFVNLRRPWPPIRGWVLQQIIKFSAVGAMQADAVIMLDSDVVLINEVKPSYLIENGAVRHYRKPNSVSSDMKNHIAWHKGAHRLLGIAPEPGSDFADYVSSFVVWDPAIVRAIQSRIEQVNAASWPSVLASEMRLSEWTIYGAYVDHIGTPRERSFTSDLSLCHSHWDTSALVMGDVERFVESLDSSDLAILVQSTSETSLEVRSKIIAAALEKFGRGKFSALEGGVSHA
ncbi:DUF6492 family protein [Rhizobium sp. Rhizsp42]|uniref:DUF6492 family protein n=1 Tax=Rhizobium sp. Rhizsp42 TaxID=3243034 RepID=UPI0039AFCE98